MLIKKLTENCLGCFSAKKKIFLEVEKKSGSSVKLVE